MNATIVSVTTRRNSSDVMSVNAGALWRGVR